MRIGKVFVLTWNDMNNIMILENDANTVCNRGIFIIT